MVQRDKKPKKNIFCKLKEGFYFIYGTQNFAKSFTVAGMKHISIINTFNKKQYWLSSENENA